MKKLTAAIIGLTAILAVGCSGKDSSIRFGAARVGAMYASFANAFTQVAEEDHEDLEIVVKNTAGTAANLRLLSEGYIQLAIAQADVTEDAYNGRGDYEKKPLQGYSAIGALYTEACQLLVREDSGINTVDDLMGHTISVGETESGTERNAKEILSIYGLNEKLVDMGNYDYTEAAEAMVNGEIDAMFCTSGTQTTVIEELARKCDVKLISLDEDHVEKLTKAYDTYVPYTIAADTYTNQKEAINTVGVECLLLARNDLGEDTVKELTESLFKHESDIGYALPMDISLQEETAVENVTIPFHAGAAAYYKDQGISVDVD